ncbi:putative endonuclease 4 OS=Streptomyces antimycoticus OX=68175 GN=nfo PE=3 SV=1 [Streptomyces antimycoticus]
MSTHRIRNPIGGHVRVAGGLATVGLAHAADIGAETVQVFVANPPAAGPPRPVHPTRDEAFRTACAERSIPAYVHAPYLINFDV